jgi:hypothetical protein
VLHDKYKEHPAEFAPPATSATLSCNACNACNASCNICCLMLRLECFQRRLLLSSRLKRPLLLSSRRLQHLLLDVAAGMPQRGRMH